MRDLHACQEHRPELAMVDSAKGITNFHSPSDVIVDASMPAMIRAGGKMYGADGRLKEVKAVMPESTFARIYQEMINFCKWHGAFDPRTMGTVPNVGLMAQQAEEYGSHDKTFEIPEDGVANITDLATGEVLLTQNVEQGDIWRMCQVKDAAIRDWVKLAVTRARNSGMPAVFWLDPYRPHEAELIKKVDDLPEGSRHQRPGHPDHVAGARDALHARARGPRPRHDRGHRQHPARLPDRPVPDHGAGHQREDAVDRAADGRRRHVRNRRRRFGTQARQQLVEENHLRWDSLGEFLALAASLEDLGIKTGNAKAKVLAKTLDAATGKLLDNRKSPSPKTGELDNRGSQFYLAMYWAQELAAQTEDPALAAHFTPLAKTLDGQRAEDRCRTRRGAGKAGGHRWLLQAR